MAASSAPQGWREAEEGGQRGERQKVTESRSVRKHHYLTKQTTPTTGGSRVKKRWAP